MRPFEHGPVRAFRDHYAAPFVGVSYDLAPGALGVHPDHLGQAPELAGRDVLVTRDRARRTPLHRRPSFRVFVLAPAMRNATEVAAEGGIVFSSFDLEDPDAAPLLADIAPGEVLYLNAAVGRLPGTAIRRPFLDEGDACAS